MYPFAERPTPTEKTPKTHCMNTAQQIEGKTILITGATRGIGQGMARVLLEYGCKVCITGRSEEAVTQGVNTLRKWVLQAADAVTGVVADVRTRAQMDAAVAHAVATFGRLDVVIANAGIGHFAPIDAMTAEQWHTTIDTNLTGVFHTVQAALPALKASKGYLITIASLAGANFFAQGAAYNASKFGLVGMTQAMMLDLRPFHIKVTTIMPGSVASHFNGHEPNENDAWKIQPEDLGQMVADLLRMHPRTLPSKIEVRPSVPKG